MARKHALLPENIDLFVDFLIKQSEKPEFKTEILTKGSFSKFKTLTADGAKEYEEIRMFYIDGITDKARTRFAGFLNRALNKTVNIGVEKVTYDAISDLATRDKMTIKDFLRKHFVKQ